MDVTTEAAATCERPTAWHRKDMLPMLFQFSTKLPPRFWSKVYADASGCWLWQGSKAGLGYGELWWEGRMQRAHRISHEALVGPIPNGHHVCHHCDVLNCVRADHLFVGTASDNMADSTRKGRNNGAFKPKSHCSVGHPFDLFNTYVAPDGDRDCRTCGNRRSRAKRAKARALKEGT